jgi:hypothetical protein
MSGTVDRLKAIDLSKLLLETAREQRQDSMDEVSISRRWAASTFLDVNCPPPTQGRTMLQKHVQPIVDETSPQRTLARVRIVTGLFIFVAAAGVAGIASLLSQPTHAADYAWCAEREYDVRCDFTTRAQCMATVSGGLGYCIENPGLIARSPSRNAYGKQSHERSK